MPSRSPNGSAPVAHEAGPRRLLVRNQNGGRRSHDLVPRRSAVHQRTPLDAPPGGSYREAGRSSTRGVGSRDAHCASLVPRRWLDAPRHRRSRPAPDDRGTHSVPVGMAVRDLIADSVIQLRRGREDALRLPVSAWLMRLPESKKPDHNDDRRPRVGAGDRRYRRDGASPFTVPRGPFRARGGAGRSGRHRAPAAGRRGDRPAPSQP